MTTPTQPTQTLLDLTYPTLPSHGQTLVSNFILSNPHWALYSLYTYCRDNYSLYLSPDESMKDVFSDACRTYINQLPACLGVQSNV